MSLYKSTYSSIIETLATSIYNKINSKSVAITSGATFRTVSNSPGKTNVTNGGDSAVANIVTVEKLNVSYAKITADKLKSDIITFIKNTLGFTDTTLTQCPNGYDMLAFIFALNYYLENTLTKVVTNVSGTTNTTTIVYKPITSGYSNKFTLYLNDESKSNTINNNMINQMYTTLRNIGDANNVGFALTTTSSTTSSSSSSSSSSSCSSSCSSSSSSSSSSLFIAYFNLT